MKDVNQSRRNLLKAAPIGAAALLIGTAAATAQTQSVPDPAKVAKVTRASAFLVKVDSLDPKMDPVNSSVIVETKLGEPLNLMGTSLAQANLIRITRDDAHSTDELEFYTVAILDLKGRELISSNMDESSSAIFTGQQLAISLRVLS